jgi:hypothetical protein
MLPKALILYLGTSGAKPGDCPCSYTFLLIHLCRNVTACFYLCFSKQPRWFSEKKLTKKIIFYCDDEALKVFRKYRFHPVFAITSVADAVCLSRGPDPHQRTLYF